MRKHLEYTIAFYESRFAACLRRARAASDEDQGEYERWMTAYRHALADLAAVIQANVPTVYPDQEGL